MIDLHVGVGGDEFDISLYDVRNIEELSQISHNLIPRISTLETLQKKTS